MIWRKNVCQNKVLPRNYNDGIESNNLVLAKSNQDIVKTWLKRSWVLLSFALLSQNQLNQLYF